MPITAFKGFQEDLTCRGFQYKEGETYEQDTPARLCSSGFHAVTSPLDVFSYYPPAESVYHRVELDDLATGQESDSKVAGRRIKIGARLSIPALVKAHIEFVMDNVKPDEYPAASNTGDRSAASNTGYWSAASNTGYWSAASNTGDRSAASNTGDRSAASNTGYRSAASNTGNWSAASNTGDRSAASNTGYQSAASVEGPESVAIVTGKDSRAAGAVGCWIVLTERDDDYKILTVKAVKVDGVKVKGGVFYTLRGGKVVTA
jgi:hypothetical protein